MKKAEEFREAAIARRIERWATGSFCTLCGYQCAYVFNWADTEVAYDGGCHCHFRPPIARTWEEVAHHYNMQSNPKVIAEYDKFWGFGITDNPESET